MPPVFAPYTGMPGMAVERIAKHRTLGGDGYFDFLPGGVVLDGVKTRDADNPDYATLGSSAQQRLRPGLMLGKVTSTGKRANSVIGVTQGALANAATSITLTLPEAAELARRVGAAGNLTLTGPAAAGGAVRGLTVPYSAVNLSTGVVTITSPGVNEVQTLNFANAPAGTFNLRITDFNGVDQETGPITYSSTVATLISNIQAAINVVIPQVAATNQIVVGGSAVTAITLTFSGTGTTPPYAGTPQPVVRTDDNGLTAGTVSVARTTPGQGGAFVAGSFVGDTDGSQVPTTFMPPGWEIPLPGDGVSDLPLAQPPIGGMLDASQLLPWPADPALQLWVMTNLNTFGRFEFTNGY